MEFHNQEAAQFFQLAFARHRQGDLDEAIELYERSIDCRPTAEAYTFKGWAYSHKGDLERAIRECLKAIQVDPDFGNPYNDIGAYLMQEERYEEALPWLDKAKRAKRYECYHYAYLNTGRIYLARHRFKEAEAEFERALELEPGYTLAKQYLRRLRSMFN